MQRNRSSNFPKGVDKPIQAGYISKAVEGNSDTETAKAAVRANLSP
ncbi:hypothetical protein [Chamaesiphon polymorphus]|nr:hypothetical protein [Chamaesiphon polymorphus]